MLLDNFEQNLESFVLNTQNAYESARNQINSLNTSKNELLKIFLGFRVFEYALWQKAKTRKCEKSIVSFLNKKHSLLMITIARKLLKSLQFIFKYHFGFNNKKSHLQASMVGSLWWLWATLWELCPEHTKWLAKLLKWVLITGKMCLWKFSVDSGFSNMLYSKKRKPGNAGNQQ